MYYKFLFVLNKTDWLPAMQQKRPNILVQPFLYIIFSAALKAAFSNLICISLFLLFPLPHTALLLGRAFFLTSQQKKNLCNSINQDKSSIQNPYFYKKLKKTE